MPGVERRLHWNLPFRAPAFSALPAFVLALASPLLVGATSPQTDIRWEEAVQQAVGWHPSVSEAIARLDARKEGIAIAEAPGRPQISGGINAGYNNGVGQGGWRPRAELSASQMLFDFGKLKGDVAIAEAGVRVGRAALLLAIDALARDTSFAVNEIQRARALDRVARDQLTSVRDINDLVHHRYRLGASTKSDWLQAQARVQAAEVTIREIEAERRRWEATLAYLLGQDAAPPLSLDPPTGLHGACERGEPDWAGIPAMMQARAERDEAQAEWRRARIDRLPTVALGGGGGANLTDPFARSDYNVGINISAPIYSGGIHAARAREAEYGLRAADAAEARVRNDIGRQISEARHQLQSLRGVVDTLNGRQSSMAETGHLYRLQYLDMGTRTLVDLLNAQQELHQVRFELVNVRFDMRRLEALCLFASGKQREAYGLSGMEVRGVTL